MRGVIGAVALAALCTPWTTIAQAAVAAPTCEARDLTPDERAAMADLVFEGTVSSATCKCMPLAMGDDFDGAQVECTDVIDVTKLVKGEKQAQFTFKNMVSIDKDSDKKLSHGTCEDRVNDRNSALEGKTSMHYMRLNSEGFYESVPKTACR